MKIESIIKEINPGNSKVASVYEKIMTMVLVKANKQDIDISMLEPKERNLFSKSEELKKIITLINLFF